MQVLVYIVLLSFTQHCSSDETLGKVVFANILYRHGDRTPDEPYPNDPYKNESLWPVPFTQLTNLGKRRHLMLGRWLRKRYAHLLSPEYSVNDIYVLSTDFDRTLISAEANLAGMYSPTEDQVWDIKDWMLIPVHTVPLKDDNIIAGLKSCKRYSLEMQRALASPEMKKIDEKNAELYEYLSRMTGMKIFSLETLRNVYNILFIEERFNKTLPAWTKSVYPNKLKPLADKSFAIEAYNKILQRLRSGPLLKNMIEHMQLKSKNALMPNRKLWVYSGHDSTIANLMMTLGVFEPHYPPYAATLLIELRINAESDYIVTIFYKNSTGEPTLLTVPGCLSACPLNQFVKLTKDVIPDDWERECSLEYEKYTFSFDAATIIVLTILLLIIFMAFVLWYKRRERYQYPTRLSTDAP